MEKKERSDTVLSNDDESVFTPSVPKTEGTKQMPIFCPDEEEFLSDEEVIFVHKSKFMWHIHYRVDLHDAIHVNVV